MKKASEPVINVVRVKSGKLLEDCRSTTEAFEKRNEVRVYVEAKCPQIRLVVCVLVRLICS